MTEETIADAGETTETTETADVAGNAQDAPSPDAAKIQALEQQIAELRAAAQPDPPPAFEPKPLFTEEEFEAVDEQQQPIYKALNALHMDNQKLEHKVAELESANEATGQEKSIDGYIASSPELADSPAAAKAFRERIRAVMRGDGLDLLEAIKVQTLASIKKPGTKPPAPASKPRNAAGSTTAKLPSGPHASVEQGMQAAKVKILSKLPKT